MTDLINLKGWPVGMRVIVRRERPHPGAQLSLFEQADGWRYQAVATNTPTGQLGFLEARHRAHARVEDRIRHAKGTGLGRFPSREYPSTKSGSSWPRSLPTWSPGFDSLPCPATWPPQSRSCCAIACCTFRPSSAAAAGDDICGCPAPGRGSLKSSPRSPRSTHSPHPADDPSNRTPTTQEPRRPAPDRQPGTPPCPTSRSTNQERSDHEPGSITALRGRPGLAFSGHQRNRYPANDEKFLIPDPSTAPGSWATFSVSHGGGSR